MKNTLVARSLYIVRALPLLLLLALPLAAFASVTGSGGPYRVELATKPAKIELGRRQLVFRITDASGTPVEDANVRTLTKMPTMDMGEREAPARPEPGQPGVYTAPASFSMEGEYVAILTIGAGPGRATVNVPLRTGLDTGTLSAPTGVHAHGGTVAAPAAGGPSLMTYLPWAVGGLFVAFVAYRVVKSGQRPNWKGVLNRQVVGGLVLLGVFLAGAVYAVNNWRRPGAMTPVEAQAMEMELPAPAGTAPVELAEVTRGAIENTVRYTGQAVGFVEQEVSPRVTGTIVEMGAYAGDRVRRGQVLARLDVSQSAPQVAGQEAALNMARQGTGVAQREYQQALAGVTEARADVATKEGALQGARADLAAAQEERASAQAALEAARTQTADAEAQVRAAQADQEYWQQQIERMRRLLERGAVTREEFQRDQAQARSADEKVKQAQARGAQVEAEIRAAQSALRKADAMIAAARSGVTEAQADVRAAQARVRSAQAMAASARQRISQAEAGVEQAEAALAGAAATRGYSEIRAQVDGVVTQRVISPGTLVNPGQTVLRVAQISPIRLQANVAEADLARVRVGTAVTVRQRDGAGAPLAARVTSVTPAVDPAARTGVVEAVVANRDARFLPGQYITMDLSTGRRAGALRVPTRALRFRTPPSGGVLSSKPQAYVWVAEPLGGEEGQYTVREVAVETGLSDGRHTEVVSGLKDGQRVVTAGQDDLKNGDTVAEVAAQATADAGTTAPQGGSAGSGGAHAGHAAGAAAAPAAPAAGASNKVYTCIMHPEVVRDRPGDCPKCGMKLIAKRQGGAR